MDRLRLPASASRALLVLLGSTILASGTAVQPASAQKLVDPLAWLAPALLSALQAPLPASIAPGSIGPVLPQTSIASSPGGTVATYQGSATFTASNAFFQSLGTNGRTCATCHAPENSMSLSVASINARYLASGGHDPLFAPIDGATCPKNVPASNTLPGLLGGLLGGLTSGTSSQSYATLLNKGLFRIFLPVPATAEFTISVVSDPYGCNTSAAYNQVTTATGAHQQIISVYRRPLMSANLKFKVNSAANTGILPPIDLVDGSALDTYVPPQGAPFGPGGNGDAEASALENGNIMSDGREPTLASQAIDATMLHAQTTRQLTTAQVQQILAFETNVYAAQYSDTLAGPLSQNGASGGPQALAADATGTISLTGGPVMTMYSSWKPAGFLDNPQRSSIYRGEEIFNNRQITVSNVSGFNNALGSNAVKATCSTCHGQLNVGSDPTARAQHDIGIGGNQAAFGGPAPASDLPIFKLTCTGNATTPFNGKVILTNDPGKALITGKCADIGRFTVAPIRGLAARAPYFTDGSAPTIAAVVGFYNKRFAIGLSAQDQQDLVNFLSAL